MKSSAPTSLTDPLSEENEKLKSHYQSIFRRVMATYDDYRSVQGVSNNSGAFGSSGNTSTGNEDGIITMSPSDFICDVETSAQHTLTAPELAFFQAVYLNKDQDFIDRLTAKMTEVRYNRVKLRVQLKLGQGFKERGVFPIPAYFQPIDTR